MRFCAKFLVLLIVATSTLFASQPAEASVAWQTYLFYDNIPTISVSPPVDATPSEPIDWQAYYNRGYSKGETTGFNVGYADGRTRGVKEGNTNGRAEGYQNGYDSTYQESYYAAYTPAFDKAWGVGYDDGFAYGAPNGYLYGYDAALVDITAWLQEQANNGSSNSSSSVSLSTGNGTLSSEINGITWGMIRISSGVMDVVRISNPWDGYTPEGYEQQGYDTGFADGHLIGDAKGYGETYESTYQLAYAPAFDEGLKAGVVQGTRLGDTDGQSDGWKDGFTWGDSDGFNIGYDWGYADGWRAIYTGSYNLNSAAAFAMTIPEPSTMFVALTAFGLLVARRRSSR